MTYTVDHVALDFDIASNLHPKWEHKKQMLRIYLTIANDTYFPPKTE
jgi:hypothetical protein